MRISDWSSDVCSSDLPFRAPDGTEQHGIGSAACGEGVVRQWSSGGIDRDSADQVVADDEVMAVALPDGMQDVHRGLGDLRTDAVPGQDADVSAHVAAPRSGCCRHAFVEIGRAWCREKVCQNGWV